MLSFLLVYHFVSSTQPFLRRTSFLDFKGRTLEEGLQVLVVSLSPDLADNIQ